MPTAAVLIYQDADGTVPLREWLLTLQAKARADCLAAMRLLGNHGYELRRPYCENLGEGVYELRVKFQRVNLRMLYFFHERGAVVVTHGFAKEKEIPPKEIEFAKVRMKAFQAKPEAHTYRGEGGEG
jgi:phage-related protein